MQRILLSTAYFPCIAWFQRAIAEEEIYLESHESFVKQTYRNRTKIMTSQGVQDLIIPVLHASKKDKIKSLQSDENQHWKGKHWNAIQSAYGKAPFFMHYAWKFEPFFKENSSIHLYQFNLDLIQLILKSLKVEVQLMETSEFSVQPEELKDLRNAFNAKGIPSEQELMLVKPYYQSFSEKYPFAPNLSILDLLFHQGPAALDYLK
jgi:hypothetical protein